MTKIFIRILAKILGYSTVNSEDVAAIWFGEAGIVETSGRLTPYHSLEKWIGGLYKTQH